MTFANVDEIAQAYLAGDAPLPEPGDCFVGDGDYRAIGAEYLRHFVHLGGLKPDERIFEIGCGIGRMAMPLRQYLSAQGRYHGMDVVSAGIEWCNATIAAGDERFTFTHADLYHPLYNATGSETATAVRLPAEDGSVDFLIASSLFTHLSKGVFEHYLGEAARMLGPGGRLFATFFLINATTEEAARNSRSRYRFDLTEPGPLFRPPGAHRLEAVAVDEAWLLERCAAIGLVPQIPNEYGFWPYEDPAYGLSYQDICVFGRSS